MHFVIAIIQPGKLTAVQEALSDLGVSGLTATEVQGYGRQKGKTEIYRGAEYTIDFVPKMKIEIAVEKALTEKVLEVISSICSTGRIGDGKIFVLDLKQAMRIRTGETGGDAL